MLSLILMDSDSIATTYYCDKNHCFLPSQQEQTKSFDTGVQNGNKFNSEGKSAPGFNYNSTDAGQNSLADKKNLGSNVIDTSKQGTQNSQAEYNNAVSDKNYIYNKGRKQIADCKTQNDPACQAVTKYNDDETQKTLSAYNMGTSAFVYSQTVTPDPNNSSCSLIRTYKPINSTDNQCIVGNHQRIDCKATIIPYQQYVPPFPSDGTTITRTINVGWDRSASSLVIKFTFFETLTKQNLVIVNAYVDGGGFNGGPQQGTPFHTIGNFNVSLNGTKDVLLGYARYYGNGHTDATSEGHLLASPGCARGRCIYNISIRGQSGGDGGNGDHTETARVVFEQPRPSSKKSAYQYNDGCKNYR